MPSAIALLRELEKLRGEFGDASATKRKVELLGLLTRRRLRTAPAVYRLHEASCFLRAYPDDARVHETVGELLARFDSRGDLRRCRRELVDSGIAGTAIHYRFYWETARWLARRWPDRLSIDWAEFENADRIVSLLHLLLPYSETPALDELDLDARNWLERLRGPDERDGAFLVRRFEVLPGNDFLRETLFESLDVPFRLEAGEDTPSRTLARTDLGGPHVSFQRRSLQRSRPDLWRELRSKPPAVSAVSRRDGARLIELAREAMVTRSRDLDAFANADPNDVRLVDFGDGLQFACFGATPERRLLLESVYGFLTLKNGVPIGYVLSSALFRSAGVAYNVFETFRGAEAASVFARVLAMVGHLFGARTFSIDPYQLGHHNREGLQSGAWWFYYKLGFRPDDAEVRRVLRQELKAMKRDPSHRSTMATLQRLSADYLYLHRAVLRPDVIGRLPLGAIGERVSAYLSRRFGSAREDGIRICSGEAMKILGLGPLEGFSAGERLAWERWSPLVMVLPGVERWPAKDKRALVRVVRAKGGRRESEFVPLFDGHARLRRALLSLARD